MRLLLIAALCAMGVGQHKDGLDTGVPSVARGHVEIKYCMS